MGTQCATQTCEATNGRGWRNLEDLNLGKHLVSSWDFARYLSFVGVSSCCLIVGKASQG